MRNIRFDPVEGKYWDGAREVPRVSRILEETGHGWKGPISTGKLVLGTYVHRATALYDAGTLDWNSLDATIRPYVDAWAKFEADTGARILSTETIVYSEQYDYCGTMDNEVILPRVDALLSMVLDKKSGGKTKSHRLQLGAYVLARQARGREHSAIIYLKPTGKYSLTLFSPEETAANVADFMSVLAEYRRQEEDLWR